MFLSEHRSINTGPTFALLRVTEGFNYCFETKSDLSARMNNDSSILLSKEASVDIITGPNFLQLPYDIRRKIYQQARIVSSEPTRHLWWDRLNIFDDMFNDSDERRPRLPGPIPRRLYRTSRELAYDALSMFWSENAFILKGEQLPSFLELGTPVMWSSLRNLDIRLQIYTDNTPWREVCNNLRAYLPPKQLTLHFDLNRWIRRPTRPRDDADATKGILRSVLELPVLKNVSFEMCPVLYHVGVHQMATAILKRHTRRHSIFSPFRFMDLPVEIRLMILGYTDLVAPGPVTASVLRGYILDSCSKRCIRGCQYCEYHYESSDLKSCWNLPAELFIVNRYISTMSEEVFFSHNELVVDVGWGAPAPLINWSSTHSGYSGRIPGVWNPQNSDFFRFPSGCIAMLRSLTWRIPRPMCGQDSAWTGLKDDWICAIDFIAENVRPLSRLTLTVDMTKSQFPDEAILPLRKLQGLRDLFVRMPGNLGDKARATEELRLERLAMGEGYHPTQEEVEEAEMFPPKDT
jgi:hypothetical protein